MAGLTDLVLTRESEGRDDTAMRVIANPQNPFESHHRELLEPPSQVTLEVYEDETRDILSRNESPDLPFRWSLNPYRGCFHACSYCYARPSHEYWGFGAGTDFDSKIVIKRQAPALLRDVFHKASWRGELIVFSGNTDCYQPLEATYGLTAISIAPVIPGLNEDDIPELLMRARQAGARSATYVLLRLSGNVETVFLERMAAAFPDRIKKMTNRIREVRGGKLSDSGFFTRHQGQGTYWKVIEQLFELGRRKAGFPDEDERPIPNTFRRPGPMQTRLFPAESP
ncbi:MAG: radical SAM protein [Nitrospirae bacterium]|nr:MAG: radical SAM protein [Nitrospirota bacterium]